MSYENVLYVIFKFSARPGNGLCAVKFVRLDYKLANVAFGGVTKLLDLNSIISLKLLRNKCVKVLLRSQRLVTIEGSWEKVGDSSLVQCKTRIVSLAHSTSLEGRSRHEVPSKPVFRALSLLVWGI